MKMTSTIELEFELTRGTTLRNGRCVNPWPGGFKKRHRTN